MRDQRVEIIGLEHRQHHIHLARRQPHRLREPLLLHLEQRLDGPVRARNLRNRLGMFRIMQMEQINLVDTECLQTCLERAPRHIGIKPVGLGVAVKFGRQHKPLRLAAHLPKRRADALLAPAKAVIAGRVDKVGRASQDRPQRLPRALLVHAVAIGVGHVAKARRTKADRRYLNFCAPKLDALHPCRLHSHLPVVCSRASHEPGSASPYSASNLFAFQVTLSDIHPPPNAPVFRVHGNRRFFPWTLTCFTGHLGALFRFLMT